jgi:hypothetical protein
MGQLDRAWKRATKIARRIDPSFNPATIDEFPPAIEVDAQGRVSAPRG